MTSSRKKHAVIVATPAKLNHVIERRAGFPVQRIVRTNPGEGLARRIGCQCFEQAVVALRVNFIDAEKVKFAAMLSGKNLCRV